MQKEKNKLTNNEERTGKNEEKVRTRKKKKTETSVEMKIYEKEPLREKNEGERTNEKS